MGGLGIAWMQARLGLVNQPVDAARKTAQFLGMVPYIHTRQISVV